jgi:hypothetical protein
MQVFASLWNGSPRSRACVELEGRPSAEVATECLNRDEVRCVEGGSAFVSAVVEHGEYCDCLQRRAGGHRKSRGEDLPEQVEGMRGNDRTCGRGRIADVKGVQPEGCLLAAKIAGELALGGISTMTSASSVPPSRTSQCASHAVAKPAEATPLADCRRVAIAVIIMTNSGLLAQFRDAGGGERP